MTQHFKLTDRLLREALRVDDRPLPSDLHASVSDAIATAGRPRRPLLALPWDLGGHPDVPGYGRVLWLALVTALLLAAMIATAIFVGSQRPLLIPSGSLQNGLVAYVAYVGRDGLPDHRGGRLPVTGTPREIFVGMPDGSQTRRLTNSSGFKDVPTWSPDGSLIAYLFEREDWGRPEPVTVGELRVLDMATGRERQIAPFDGRRVKRYDSLKISWSPDGSRLAYSDGAGVHIVGVGGTGHVLVDAEACCPAWSPDGGRLSYQDSSGLSLYDLAATASTPLIRAPAIASVPGPGGPGWSSDGRLIVFWSGLDSGGIEIVASDASGRRLLAEGMWPALSPDSALIAFTSGGRDVIFTARLDGTLFKVSERSPGEGGPRWSPDGRWIAFDAQALDGASETWIVRPDGSGRQRLETGPEGGVQGLTWDWQPVSD